MKVPQTALRILAFLSWAPFAADALGEMPENALYTSTATAIQFHEAGLTVSKTPGSVRFNGVNEMGGNPDVQLIFRNDEEWIVCLVTVYPAPEGTAGPEILLDEAGEPLPADDPDNPYAVFRLSEPSEAFLREFDEAIEYIENAYGFEMTNENRRPIRMLAVPDDPANSPIGYVANFRGTGGFKHPELSDYPWDWNFRFYVSGDHFVKIHTEGPARLETDMAASEMVSAVEWLEVGKYNQGGAAHEVAGEDRSDAHNAE